MRHHGLVIAFSYLEGAACFGRRVIRSSLLCILAVSTVVFVAQRPSTVAAQDPGRSGMERSADTHGQCCWPGQGWTGTACVGRPTGCPVGFEFGANGCEEPFLECPTGQIVMADQQHCCWPGQRWDGLCVGSPSCPQGFVRVGMSCEASPECLPGQELTFDRLHCCWPGQAWSSTSGSCIGVPTACPDGFEKTDADCMHPNLVHVPAGGFWMGCAPSDTCREEEGEGRQVSLPGFWIERAEVTVARYARCVRAGVCAEPKTGREVYNWDKSWREDHPVNGVTLKDAETYCAWMGRRLPTAVEWVKAARGTDLRSHPWGDARPDCHHAVMDDGREGCGSGTTAAVGSKPAGASPYGALDMVGNVAEWTADSRQSRPECSETVETLFFRGGSYFVGAESQRSSAVGWSCAGPDSSGPAVGFRCAK